MAKSTIPKYSWKPKLFTPEELAAKKIENSGEVDRLIKLANQYPDSVAAVAIGNEALVEWNDHMVPVESVISYVKKVKRSIKQPVTVADNYDWWARFGKSLAEHLDFLSVHIYPVWEGKPVEEGRSFGGANMEAVRKALPAAKLVITEAGWATVASEFGERATQGAQARYSSGDEILGGEKSHHHLLLRSLRRRLARRPKQPQGGREALGHFRH
jgi:exo-beta-1,3-glucanase (GH17 family)